MRAPFPWFGGKSRVAGEIWDRFGDVPNYVEPFAGSLAVLLARPTPPQTETINDLDCYVANFWRATQHDPGAVAAFTDWPVNEADLLARHTWLLKQNTFRDRMRLDADYFDAKIAGWWVWGLCAWIGSGWCRVRGDGPPSQLPHLGDAGRGDWLVSVLSELSARLRHVRVACGSWDRVLGESVTVKHGVTGVLLDPPYPDAEHSVEYGSADGDPAREAQAWALANADNTLLLIAYCGYEGSVEFPPEWESLEWKAQGGYGSQGDEGGKGRENARRERVWFSPSCRRVGNRSLFDAVEAAEAAP